MAVLNVIEDFGSMTGTITFSGNKFSRDYNRKFKVFTSSDLDDASVVLNHVDIPLMLQKYPTDDWSLVQKKTASKINDTPRCWMISVDYSSTFDGNPQTMVENPLLRPPVWKFSFTQQEKFIRADLDDKPINNSVGQPIEPGISMPYSIETIEITVNKIAFPYWAICDLVNRVNEDVWNVFPEKTVKIVGVTAQEKFEAGLVFWEVVWSLAYRSEDYDAWDCLVLDQGWSYKNAAGKIVLATDLLNRPLPNPSMLMSDGSLKLPTDPPHYLEFRVLETYQFTGNIP